jgi:hypothetical protein
MNMESKKNRRPTQYIDQQGGAGDSTSSMDYQSMAIGCGLACVCCALLLSSLLAAGGGGGYYLFQNKCLPKVPVSRI